jgi:hypothetical protein
MGFKTILVPTEQHDLMSSTLETALLLARKFDSYIQGFALRGEIPAIVAMGDIGGLPIPALEQEGAEERNGRAACSRTSCKNTVCRVEVKQKPCHAIGWKMPLRATTLWAAMAASSMSLCWVDPVGVQRVRE